MNLNYQASTRIPLWQPARALLGEHRGLIRAMVRRDLAMRYQGSVMGIAWAIINPAMMIVIFTIIFAGIFQARFGESGSQLSFALYLFCGMLPWSAFSEGVQRATTSVTENVNLVKRVVFPVEALPVNTALAAIVQQLLGTIVLLTAALIIEHSLKPTALLLPVLLIPQLLVTLGLGWLMASLGVFLRDVPQISQIILNAWMYLTPIFYPEHLIPPAYQGLLKFNPMVPLIRSYRRILLEGRMPDWQGLGITTLFGLVCFIFGYWWFIRTRKAFPDVL